MGTVSLKAKPGQHTLLTEVPGCLELLIDQTGTIYTPNLDEISEVCKDDFKQMCKMLAQVALMEMQAPRILH